MYMPHDSIFVRIFVRTGTGAHVCARVHACVHVCVRVCACMRVRVNSGLNMHDGFLLTHYTRISYLRIKSPKFISCGTIYLYLDLHVKWRNLERTIVQFNHDHRFSLTLSGTWLHMIRRRFILRSFNFNHSCGSYNGQH